MSDDIKILREDVEVAREGIDTFNIVASFAAGIFGSQFLQQAQEYWNFPQLVCLIVYGCIALVAILILAWLHFRERGLNRFERELRAREVELEKRRVARRVNEEEEDY